MSYNIQVFVCYITRYIEKCDITENRLVTAQGKKAFEFLYYFMKSVYYLTKLCAKSSSYENDIKDKKTIVIWIEDRSRK